MKYRVIRSVAALLVASLMGAACGTRLADSAFEQASSGQVQAGNSDRNDNSGADDLGGDDLALGGDTATGTGAGSGPATGGGGPSTRGIKPGGGADNAPNAASEVGVTATTITLGTIVAENGVLGDAFAPAARGIRAWAAATNAAGGIRGRKVILKTCDDREDRNRTLQCAQQLVERDKVFALVSTNTRSFGGAAQYLADRSIPVVGFPITNSFYRYPTFFSAYGHGYPRDGKNVGVNGQLLYSTGIYRWFKQNVGVTKAAVFFYDVDESKQAGEGFAKGMKLEGFEVTQYAVSFAAPSFDQAVAQMQRDGTQLILDAMDDGANRKLCDAMERRKFSVKAKVSTIVSMGEAVGNNYNDTCRNVVYVPGQTINYQQTAVPEVAKFRQAYKRYQPGIPLHQWALESWMMARMVEEYVNRAAPTRKGLVDYLNGLTDYTGNGLDVGLDWGKPSGSGGRTKDCFTIARWQDSAGGWTSAANKFPFCYPDAFQYPTPALEQGN